MASNISTTFSLREEFAGFDYTPLHHRRLAKSFQKGTDFFREFKPLKTHFFSSLSTFMLPAHIWILKNGVSYNNKFYSQIQS